MVRFKNSGRFKEFIVICTVRKRVYIEIPVLLFTLNDFKHLRLSKKIERDI